MVCSMSRPGNCLDNAPAESFFHSLKTEWLYHFTLYPRAQARSRVFEYIEGFYNRTRLHSALGYRSPEQYEKLVVTSPRVHFFGGTSVSSSAALGCPTPGCRCLERDENGMRTKQER